MYFELKKLVMFYWRRKYLNLMCSVRDQVPGEYPTEALTAVSYVQMDATTSNNVGPSCVLVYHAKLLLSCLQGDHA